MQYKHIDSITEDDIKQLIEHEVAENKHFEYKRDLPRKKSDQEKNMLKSVCAFANSEGGNLIFGIEEDKGIPQKVVGVECDNFDDEILRIESVIRDGIEPVVFGIKTKIILCSDANNVLLIQIPKSMQAPHRNKKTWEFHWRNSAGKNPMGMNEIANMIIAADSLGNRLREWKRDRVMRVVDRKTPLPIGPLQNFILHFAPADMFGKQSRVDGDFFEQANWDDKVNGFFSPVFSESSDPRHNLDGFFTYINRAERQPPHGYIQSFNSCAAELVFGFQLRNHEHHKGCRKLPADLLERTVLRKAYQYFQLFGEHVVGIPVYVFLTILDSDKLVLEQGGYADNLADRDQLDFTEIVIHPAEEKLPNSFRPLFDSLWNAYDYPRSKTYDEDGNYTRSYE